MFFLQFNGRGLLPPQCKKSHQQFNEAKITQKLNMIISRTPFSEWGFKGMECNNKETQKRPTVLSCKFVNRIFWVTCVWIFLPTMGLEPYLFARSQQNNVQLFQKYQNCQCLAISGHWKLYPCYTKIMEVLWNPSTTPKRFPNTREISRGKSRESRKISRVESRDFPIPPVFHWTMDILSSSAGKDWF